jgi:endonuclease/exonuclease/phosphatase family metal-dependent hydrolase
MPVILAGDFNMEPGSSEYQTITARANDFTYGSNLLTFPSDKPSRQIDYVFASHGVKPMFAKTVDATESDHLPVKVRT